MASAWGPVATPPQARDRQPTDLEKQFFKAYPNLGTNFRIVTERSTVYNCFGWTLGFNERWVDGGTPVQMQRLYAYYFYIPAQSANDAEIDLYIKRDAPPTITVPRRGAIPNPRYNVATHAHRNDDRNAALGSTSKMQAGTVIRHSRMALTDNRPWDKAVYGQISGYYRKHSEHPLNPGKESNVNLIPGRPPGPNHPSMWADPGLYPIGHPLEGATGGLYSFQGDSAGGAMAASSLRFYAPFRSVPGPSQAAVDHIRKVQNEMYKNKNAYQLINQFEARYRAWKQTWFTGQQATSANSITRTQVPEFDALVSLSPTIVPLVVAKLCNPDDFMATQLYNRLETSRLYKVSPMDAPNYLVLQRQANLIIELNKGRFFKSL